MSKRLLFVVIFTVGLLESSPVARAQQSPKMRFGAEGALVLPYGDWGDTVNKGIGVMGRVDAMRTERLRFSFHPGFIYHLPQTETDILGRETRIGFSELLIAGGLRYLVAPRYSLIAETGMNIWRGTVSIEDEQASDTTLRIPVLLGVSYQHPRGLTLSGIAFVPNMLLTERDEDPGLSFMLNVGYMMP